MFNHIIYKGKAKYNKKNKIILIAIRKQPGELDWIMPILDRLKKNFNIIVIFEKQVALKLLKQNEALFHLFQKTVFSYVQNSNTKSIFYRFCNKITNFTKIQSLTIFFQKKIFEEYYNIDNLNCEIQQKFNNFDIQKINILMQDFTDNSPWIKQFSEKNKNLKIISYPHATHIYNNKKFKIKNKVSFNNSSYLLLSSSSDISYFKSKFSLSYVYICGFPKYEKSWLKKLENSYRVKKEKNQSIFIAYKGFEKGKYIKDMYIKQVESLFDFAQAEKNIILVFKFHPNAQEEKVFLSVANRYSQDLWKITKEHLHIASKRYTTLVSFYDTASVLDSLANDKLPIELWDIRTIDYQNKLRKTQGYITSVYSDLKLCLQAKNKFFLKKYLQKILYNQHIDIQKKILNRFSKVCKIKNSIDTTNKMILKISRTLT